MDLTKKKRDITTYFLITTLSVVLVTMCGTPNNVINESWADTSQASNDQIRDSYFMNIQDILDNGIGESPFKLNNEIDKLNETLGGFSQDGETNDNDTLGTETLGGFSQDGETNDNDTHGTETLGGFSQDGETNDNDTLGTQDQVENNGIDINIKNENTQKLEIRLESIISEEEGEEPIPQEEQRKVESEDQIVMREHKSLTGENCRTENVLTGASNEKDLKVLAECQEAVGIVKHTKKMDDGDFKFFLELDEKYKFLVNEKNIQKTDGFLVVEIVPPDQNVENVYLPKTGDQVHIWGAWVTDKPKGWHEIHPTWKVINE